MAPVPSESSSSLKWGDRLPVLAARSLHSVFRSLGLRGAGQPAAHCPALARPLLKAYDVGFSDLLSWLDGGLLFQGLLVPSAGEPLKLSSWPTPGGCVKPGLPQPGDEPLVLVPELPALGWAPPPPRHPGWRGRRCWLGFSSCCCCCWCCLPPSSWCCPLTSSVSAVCWAAAGRAPQGALPCAATSGKGKF